MHQGPQIHKEAYLKQLLKRYDPDAESVMALTEKDNRKIRKPFREYDFNPNCFFESQKFRHRVEFRPKHCDTADFGKSSALWTEPQERSPEACFRRDGKHELPPQNFIKTACLTRAINRCMNFPCFTEPGQLKAA